MRRVLGPLLLAAVALAALLFLQHRGGGADQARTGGIPEQTSTTSSPATRDAPLPIRPTTSPSPSPTSTTTVAVTAGSDLPDPDPDGGTPLPPSSTATARNAAQATQWAAAVAQATDFMAAFARPAPTVDAVTWWQHVTPFLTDQATSDYAGTDPANVPFTHVTGPGAVLPVDAPDSLLIAVRIPTDAGAYLVEIQSTEYGPRVARATPRP